MPATPEEYDFESPEPEKPRESSPAKAQSEYDFESPAVDGAFDFESPKPIDSGSGIKRRPCPMCGEMIAESAKMCRFCGDRFTKGEGRLSGEVDREMVKKFRREVHGIGGFWIFIAVLNALVGWFLSTSLAGENEPALRLILLGVFACIVLIYVMIGVFTFLKHRWAMYVGLVFAYLGILGSVIQFANGNLCAIGLGTALHLAVVIQTHRTLKWANLMAAEGIPLTAKPEDYD